MPAARADTHEVAQGLATLPHVLRWHADHQPARLAYRFLHDRGSRESLMTFAQLASRSAAIARRLRTCGAAGDRVLLVLPPGLDLVAAFYGCLCARKVAVLLPEPHAAQKEAWGVRLARIADDTRPAAVVCAPTIRHTLQTDGVPPHLQSATWVSLDEDTTGASESWDVPEARPEDLAFLQYTSGSTSRPRGVMVTHGNLMHNLAAIRERFAVTSASRIVSWLPPYHDMGLVGGILQPLYAGASATLLATTDFVQQPRLWLSAISKYGGTTSGGPDFAFELCVRRIGAAQRSELDLRSWQVAFNGAEPIRAETIERFAAEFEACGFRREAFSPCYGLAEATLMVSASPAGVAPVVRRVRREDLERGVAVASSAGAEATCALVSSGRAHGDTIVVDPGSRNVRPAGGVGEIWHRSASVARGYWNDPENTALTFDGRLRDEDRGPWLRTGDLGFIEDGELFVTGRLKDLVIIDGRNHHPADLEETAGSCHVLLRPRDCVAIPVHDAGREELVLLVGVRRIGDTDLGLVEKAVRAAMSREHGIRVRAVVFVRGGSLPRTDSGKIRRLACRQAWRDGSLVRMESP